MDGAMNQCDWERVVVLGKQVERDLNSAYNSSRRTAYNHLHQFEPGVREFQRAADIHAAQDTCNEQGHMLMYVPITDQHLAVSVRTPSTVNRQP